MRSTSDTDKPIARSAALARALVSLSMRVRTKVPEGRCRVREKLAAMALDEHDITDAVRWARRGG
jgi:SOS response regulatory protein OraA/RecX